MYLIFLLFLFLNLFSYYFILNKHHVFCSRFKIVCQLQLHLIIGVKKDNDPYCIFTHFFLVISMVFHGITSFVFTPLRRCYLENSHHFYNKEKNKKWYKKKVVHSFRGKVLIDQFSFVIKGCLRFSHIFF